MGVEVVYYVIELSKEVKHALSSQQLKMSYVKGCPHVLLVITLKEHNYHNFSLTNTI